MKIRKGDNVAVMAGKDRGKTGLIERVFPNEEKFIVKGIGIAKKSIKPSKKNPQGGIIEINQKINGSNLMIVCPSCGKATKVGYKVTDKSKLRICKKCGANIEGGNK